MTRKGENEVIDEEREAGIVLIRAWHVGIVWVGDTLF